MALGRYGVLSGTLVSHARDTADSQGRWFQVDVTVNASGVQYRCAIDVGSQQSNAGVEWRVVPVSSADVEAMLALPPGYHNLQHTSTSGGWDYVRSALFRVRLGRVLVMSPASLMELLRRFVAACRQPWQRGDHVQASAALEALLVVGRRVLIWGEPSTHGNGMHNVHQNQGDLVGPEWWTENGTWQDGGTLAEQADGTWTAFINKFTTQAYRTDSKGHPAPWST